MELGLDQDTRVPRRGRQRLPRVPSRSPASSLPPTARKILIAAKHLLTTRGLSALTLETVTNRAGVNKALVRYYFGSKAGLIEAVVDEIVLDECASMANDLSANTTVAERVRSFVASVRRMATNVDGYRAFFDVLPHGARDRGLRRRLTYLYDLWYEWNLEWLGLDDATADDERAAGLRAMGAFTAAVIDGIAVQALIHGAEYDVEPTLDILERCLLRMLEE
ncbi:MAG: TetR/AcrR family transcriptional regulator [Actinobacteria bacterium]|nr:TetR/AcrR family transcriptional regulator [Actinomycetota bacterium]